MRSRTERSRERPLFVADVARDTLWQITVTEFHAATVDSASLKHGKSKEHFLPQFRWRVIYT